MNASATSFDSLIFLNFNEVHKIHFHSEFTSYNDAGGH